MYSVQRILVIGGILLLTTLILNFHRANSYQTTLALYNEGLISATGIGQSIIDEIQTRAFDEQTVSKSISTTDSLTTAALLGPETGESGPALFDDTDDYNNYQRNDTLSRLGVFTTQVQIYYVPKMNPSSKSLSRTFTKRIDISVTNAYLTDTLKLNHIIAY